MKRSFFIAFFLYLGVGILLFRFAWSPTTPQESKTTRISLASIDIVKPQQSQQPQPKQVQKSEPQKPKRLEQKSVQPKKRLQKHKKRAKKVVHKKPRIAKKPQRIAATKPLAPQKPPQRPAKATPQNEQSVATPKQSHALTKEARAPSAPPKKESTISYERLFLSKYAHLIRAAIVRHKFYPRIARRTKKEGVVELYFELTPKKKLQNLRILRSSGHAVLDRAAIRCLQSACEEFPTPKECVKVRVPIEYRLR